jgi:hypothetical protein
LTFVAVGVAKLASVNSKTEVNSNTVHLRVADRMTTARRRLVERGD